MSQDDLEAEVLEIARRAGKFAAVQHYRRATGDRVKIARSAVEEILWRHGVRSMTPPRLRRPGPILLLAGSAAVGLGLALVLILLFG